jgi:hypothetical protein
VRTPIVLVLPGTQPDDQNSHHHEGTHLLLQQTKPVVDRAQQLWNTNHAPANVKKFAKFQLELWGLDKFDLYLMHFPIALKFVDAAEKFPAEWEHPSGGVQLGPCAAPAPPRRC